MQTNERARRNLYESLERALGGEEAETLMAHLPPTGFADLATKADLEALGDRLDGRIDALGDQFAGRIDALGDQFAGRIDALGSRLDGRIDVLGSRLDGRIDVLTADVAALRAGTEREFAAVHKTLERIDQTLGRLDLRIDSVQHGMVVQTRWFVGGTIGAVIAVSALPQVLGLVAA